MKQSVWGTLQLLLWMLHSVSVFQRGPCLCHLQSFIKRILFHLRSAHAKELSLVSTRNEQAITLFNILSKKWNLMLSSQLCYSHSFFWISFILYLSEWAYTEEKGVLSFVGDVGCVLGLFWCWFFYHLYWAIKAYLSWYKMYLKYIYHGIFLLDVSKFKC